MRILSWSNFLHQVTGYGTCQRELLPRIAGSTDHDVFQLAASGVDNAGPFVYEGVTVYPSSSQGGTLAAEDIQPLCDREDIDLILAQFDMWHIHQAVRQLQELKNVPPIVPYAPIDNQDPGGPAPNWQPILQNAPVNVPYCDFGARMMRKAGVDGDHIWTPIYHGVDTDVFRPVDVSKPDVFPTSSIDVDDSDFVVGYFKNNQGQRAQHERALHAFRTFLDEAGVEDRAYLYLHCSIHGTSSPEIPHWVDKLGLEDNVIMPAEAEYRWGLSEEKLNLRYNGCDVVLNTTKGEGFGLPILESMASGTPVIGGAYSSMPELIMGNPHEIRWEDAQQPFLTGTRGWCVPVWDVHFTLQKQSYTRQYKIEHIADTLEHVYGSLDEVALRGKEGREFAEKHTWDEKAGEFIDLLDFLEDDLWSEDEMWGDVQWQKIGEAGSELGGVGAFRGS